VTEQGLRRFLLPCFTTDAEHAANEHQWTAADAPALPTLSDPPSQRVTDFDPEPLVPLEHRRVRVLSNYWHAGWKEAIPTTWLRAEALDRLGHVADALPDRLGLAVFDAWRPLSLQAELWDAAYSEPGLPEGYVAEPIADPATPPPHVTGGVVDLTLTLDGVPLALGTGFDDFTVQAAPTALEHRPGIARDLRRTLYHAMRGGGFVVLHCEWWHFEFGTRRWAAITGNRPRYGPAAPPPSA